MGVSSESVPTLFDTFYTFGIRRVEATGLRSCDLQPRPEEGQIIVFAKAREAVPVPAGLWNDPLELRGGASSEVPVFANRRRALVGAESALKRRVARPLDLSIGNLIVART